ncbi:MAG: hypothetical protein APF80_06765 [Alphaproteobacteria bacterium BRH_c36]|nr:MAG: hypothetical protein APF80_06765 [Alphaproteobacteria bacterium BRH_c36]
MHNLNRRRLWAAGLTICAIALGLALPALAQVPVDAAGDRRVDDYVFFQSFGEPKTPFKDLESAGQVRADSAEYFRSELATCDTRKETCDPDNVYELADRFCQSLEFHEAATWRVSRDGDELVLHWAVCGLRN